MARGLATALKIRELIVKKHNEGKSMSQIAFELDIPKSTVGDIIKKHKNTGSLNTAGKSTGRPRLVTERKRRLLVKICKEHRRSTLREITALWNEQSGLNIGRECCRKWIKTSGLGFYKVQLN